MSAQLPQGDDLSDRQFDLLIWKAKEQVELIACSFVLGVWGMGYGVLGID